MAPMEVVARRPGETVERDLERLQRADRRSATTIGILYLVADVAGVFSLLAAGSLVGPHATLADISAEPKRLAVGALLVLVMGFALAMVAAVFFPILRRYNEPLAVGVVIFRGALETLAYVATAATWLLLIRVADASANASGPDANASASIGLVLRDANDLLGDTITSLVFSVGALMLCWVLYTSRLVPRWLSVWGLVGAALFLVAPLLRGPRTATLPHQHEPAQVRHVRPGKIVERGPLRVFDVSWGFLMAPLAVQEIVMAVWLITKGFTTDGTVSTSAV
jgi:hypothetical protein